MSALGDFLLTAIGAKAEPGPAPDLFGFLNSPGRRIANRGAARHTEAYGGQEAIDWVMNCVALYAVTAANATYYFERDGQRLVQYPRRPEAPEGAGQAPPDLVSLFKRPNRTTDYASLIELSIIDLLLAGEFFYYLSEINGLGQPQEIYRVAPHLMEVLPGKVAPEGYIYNTPGGEPQHWAPEDVLHVKRPNPHDPWRGLGVIAGNPRMYDIALGLDEAIAQYYEQGTRLSGVLETDRTVPPSTFEKLKRQFTNLYSGRANAYKVATLERGLTFKAISGSADQAQFGNAQESVRDRISAAFGVPTPLLGDVGGSTDRQAVKEAQRIWDNKIFRPFLNRMQSQISAGLTQAWGVDFCIEYQYVMPIEDKLDLAANLALLPGIKVREVRKQVDLDPLGDERDDIVINLPGLPTDEGGHPDPNLPGEPGRPPKRENVPPFPNPGYPLPQSAAASKAYGAEDPSLMVRRMIHELRKAALELQRGS